MREANFDGLVGPTHNYSGLAFGNVASEKNASLASNPRAAALQGVEKMRLLHSLGLPQGIFPPQPRPALRWLAALGFTGGVREVMARVSNEAPELLPYCYSSSGMWAANAATITPSCDSADGTMHITPANLTSTPHRALESRFTSKFLARIFSGDAFTHHAPLPPGPLTPDEGAANHTALRALGAKQYLHIFVYGRDAARKSAEPSRFPARQTLQASQAVARLHALPPEQTIFLQQSPVAIDAGVFHNDVISVGHENVLLYHARAFADSEAAIRSIAEKQPSNSWYFLRVEEQELALPDVVASYLFNSQLVTIPGGDMALIAPKECEENPAVAAIIRRWIEGNNPLARTYFMDLKQSMRNGGGPACLRLRVPLSRDEWDSVNDGVKWSEPLYDTLKEFITKRYRDRLTPDDLKDPDFAVEVLEVLEELSDIFGMEGLYDGEY